MVNLNCIKLQVRQPPISSYSKYRHVLAYMTILTEGDEIQSFENRPDKNLSGMLWGCPILKKRMRENGKNLPPLNFLIFHHENVAFSGKSIYFTFPVNSEAP